ncbi:MAG: hypothetical protein AB8H79_02885 [Myxococcota bacterium]
MRHALTLTLASTLLTSCVINSNQYTRPRDLQPQSQVVGLRILAIQAEPPELAPGETATLQALLVDLGGVSDNTLWVGCGPDAASNFGCPFDPSALDEDATFEELIAAGVIGLEPDLPPTLTAQEEWLEGLDEDEQLEGLNWTVNALALPADAPADGEFDFNQVESAFKRVVVSRATTPNRNPGLVDFTVDGEVVADGEVAIITPGKSYELAPVLADDAIQTYDFKNRDGEVEERVEQLYCEWFSTSGTVTEFNTLEPFLESTWVAPDVTGRTGRWFVVVKDRRGGLSWLVRDWEIR